MDERRQTKKRGGARGVFLRGKRKSPYLEGVGRKAALSSLKGKKVMFSYPSRWSII